MKNNRNPETGEEFLGQLTRCKGNRAKMKVFSFFTLLSCLILSLKAMELELEEPRIDFEKVRVRFQKYLDQKLASSDVVALFCRYEDLLLILSSLDQTINDLGNKLAANERRLKVVQSALKKHVGYAEDSWQDTFSCADLTDEAKDKELKGLRDEHKNLLKTSENLKVIILNNNYEIGVSRRHKDVYLSALYRISDILQETMQGTIYSVQADDFGLEPGELLDVPIYPLDPDWESHKVMILGAMRKTSSIEYDLKVEDAEGVAASLAKKGATVLVVKYDPFIVQVFDENLPAATYDAYNPIPDCDFKFGVLHMKHLDISELCPRRTSADNEREKNLIPNLKGMRILRRMVFFQFSFALDYDYDTIVVDLGYPAAEYLCPSVYHSIYQHYIKLFTGTNLRKVIFANGGTQEQIIVDDEDAEEFTEDTASTEEF